MWQRQKKKQFTKNPKGLFKYIITPFLAISDPLSSPSFIYYNTDLKRVKNTPPPRGVIMYLTAPKLAKRNFLDIEVK